ncbi:MAG: hypothetical protein KJO91_01710, partial [Gammaproteobacteria bacterium]|nr:hypothetical protein [Gammaproteobacteria bacterium]
MNMLTDILASSRYSRALLTTFAILVLTGCVLEEDISQTSGGEVTINGSVGDGPVIGATVTVYNSSGEVVDTILSDGQARYQSKIKAKGHEFPLRIEAIGGTDLVTGRVPDFNMQSVMAHPSVKAVNINPFTTLIVQVAERMSGGLGSDNVANATVIVMDAFSFGLDGNQVPDPLTTSIQDSNVSHIVKASESMGEMVRRTRDQLRLTGSTVDGDAV